MALAFGVLFFIFAVKYYIAIIIALLGDNRGSRNGGQIGHPRGDSALICLEQKEERASDGSESNGGGCRRYHDDVEPFISIHLPFYNERNVARRVIQACVDIDYSNYEILIIDDSRDETIEILKELCRRRGPPTIKVVHRRDRRGFKGGALAEALRHMDPRAEYIMVFDADFIPPPDIIRQFLVYFEDRNESEGDGQRVAAVQGYQLHHLNKRENWITRGVRAEFSGSYMIERTAEEFFGAMKMISGSVFMLKADVARELGWTTSLTEDWDLTLRLYMGGYKVAYTPLIQAPAEIPTTIRRLAGQRMRWAEGHTFAVKRHFWGVLRSPMITIREKLEFLYFVPYYLQSLFFMAGTLCWIISELLHQHPWFWMETFGWCLVLSNLLALPLMSLAGLFLEQTALEDFTGIFSFIALSYIMAPFQAYAALKGLLEGEEGTWIRTLKTGSITDKLLQIRVRKLFSWVLPERRRRAVKRKAKRDHNPSAIALLCLVLMSSLIMGVAIAAMSKPEGEVWLKSDPGGTAYYIDYGSVAKRSRIEFPGIVMFDRALPLILAAALISLVVLRLKGGGEEG